ncbi:MAG: mechanosensitive ion channel family protein [Bacteroidales bacterium]
MKMELGKIVDNFLSFLPELGVSAALLVVFLILSGAVKRTVTRRIKPKTKNPLLAEFLGRIAAFLITLTGLILALQVVGLGGIAGHIVAGAGLTTLIVGFAFKDIGENFLAGILMAFKSPFKIGDLIETAGTTGYVNGLDLRTTSVKTTDGKDVFIPNAQIIKNPLYNYTIDGFLRYEIRVGIDYQADPSRAIAAIHQVLEGVPDVLQGEKKPVVIVDELLSSSILIRVFYWIDTFESKSRAYHLLLKSDITVRLLEALAGQGIYLPGDIVEIKNYRDQPMVTT